MTTPTCAICLRTYSGVWNGKKYDRVGFFKRNMKSLFAHTHIDYKLFIIDDLSGILPQLRFLDALTNHPQVEVHIKPKHLGRQHSFAWQRKLGYDSGAPYIYLCDDDYEYRDNWLRDLIEGYEVLKRNWKSRPVGCLSGFHRQGFKPDKMLTYEGKQFGLTSRWLGCRWLMARDVLGKCGYNDIKPEKGWPRNDAQKKWTSPWIDDGSYQFRMTEKYGFEHAFVQIEKPSMIEHIGTFGVHSRLKKHVWGAK